MKTCNDKKTQEEIILKGIEIRRTRLVYESINLPAETTNRNDNLLPNPSEEQHEVLKKFKEGYNIKIQAVAGSGKTTVLLHIAKISKEDFGLKSLILTYNKSLQEEITKRIHYCGFSDKCKVYTYHGYASKIYGKSIHNDELLLEYLKKDQSVCIDLPILLLDEVQDMSQIHYDLVTKIISYNTRLVLVGDKRQCIYDHNGSTSKYLTEYEQYFKSEKKWMELTLRTSYRLTPSLANFVNNNIINENLIIPGNYTYPDIKPLYYYSAFSFATAKLFEKAVEIFGPDEVVLMCPSVKTVKNLDEITKTNKLNALGKLINNCKDIKFCIREEEGSLTQEIMNGKVLISSFHSMKGKEKKCVILYYQDESYFKYYATDWLSIEKQLPNVLYVAATRAKCCLMVIQNDDSEILRSTNINKIHSTCNVIDIKNKMCKFENPNKAFFPKKTESKIKSVTDFISKLTTTNNNKLLNLIETKIINKGTNTLIYKHIIEFDELREDVRSYYGILIPMITEYKIYGEINIFYKKLISIGDEVPDEIINRYENLLSNNNKTINEWMEIAVYISALSTFHFLKIRQILNYDWVDNLFIEKSVNKLLETITNKGLFEVTIINDFFGLSGRMDYLTDNDIWEFKNSELASKDKIQCATYLVMYYLKNKKMLTGKLFSSRTSELIEITVKDPELFIKILTRCE